MTNKKSNIKKPLVLTKEEKELTIKILSTAPLQGSMQTLTPTLQKIAKIVNKIQESMSIGEPDEEANL